MAENPWITVLMITVLGMGLLFLALAFFYGLLTAMARLFQDRDGTPGQPTAAVPDPAPDPAAAGEEEARWRAAAVAVVLARASLSAPRARRPAPPGEGEAAVPGPASRSPSPWWSLHHGRRLASGARREESR